MFIARSLACLFTVLFMVALNGCTADLCDMPGNAPERAAYEKSAKECNAACATDGGYCVWTMKTGAVACCSDKNVLDQRACLWNRTTPEYSPLVRRVTKGESAPTSCLAHPNDQDIQTVIASLDPMNPAADPDKDGYLGEHDQCPMTAGTLQGCPDRDQDGVRDQDDVCPDTVAGANPDQMRRGCPGTTMPIETCSALGWSNDGSRACVQNPSKIGVLRTTSWTAPYAFDQAASGTWQMVQGKRIIAGIIVLDSGGSFLSGSFQACSANGVCSSFTNKANTIFAIGRPGDEYVSVRPDVAGTKFRIAYYEDGVTKSMVCTTLDNMITDSCRPSGL